MYACIPCMQVCTCVMPAWWLVYCVFLMSSCVYYSRMTSQLAGHMCTQASLLAKCAHKPTCWPYVRCARQCAHATRCPSQLIPACWLHISTAWQLSQMSTCLHLVDSEEADSVWLGDCESPVCVCVCVRVSVCECVES